jgi:hypothetical protein
MRVEAALVDAIAVHSYEWRHARVWSLDRVNLMAIERQASDELPVVLKYKFNEESWQAESKGQALTRELDAPRANFMLSVLEGLKATRWLSPSDDAAATALASPSLSMAVIEKTVNDQGDFSGMNTRKVSFAPSSPGPNPGFYYGRLSTGPHPFLISQEVYQKLAGELFEK